MVKNIILKPPCNNKSFLDTLYCAHTIEDNCVTHSFQDDPFSKYDVINKSIL